VGAATGVVAAGAVCEVTSFAETVSVLLVVDLAVCSTLGPEGVLDTDVGWDCGSSTWFSFCSKAARSAAWAGVSLARTERKLAQRATQKPTKVMPFIKRPFRSKNNEMARPSMI
jgi:hypothetical protein